MQSETELLKKRLIELAHRAFSQQRYAYSDFLTTAEQEVLLGLKGDAASAGFSLHGGYEGAERKLACFGDEELCGYQDEPPISCIKIAPLSQKFADPLTHRDFLGALMALGVKRSVLGDIILSENCGYLLCQETIADFVLREFTQVKRTTVGCERLDSLPALALPQPDSRSVNVASERLDALVAAVYKLSRSESQALFSQGKVYINSRQTENTSQQPNPGDMISVRGLGRFSYEGISKETKKGRLFVDVLVY